MDMQESANGSTTVVAIAAPVTDEAEVIPKLRQFAWDEPVPRIARLGDDILVDLAEVAGDEALDRLERLLGRRVRRIDPVPTLWTLLNVHEEDG